MSRGTGDLGLIRAGILWASIVDSALYPGLASQNEVLIPALFMAQIEAIWATEHGPIISPRSQKVSHADVFDFKLFTTIGKNSK